jgi:serine-type D-Ala-D-Ala carboxypeptidase (penicillin-binding protein 5/6)
VSLGTAWRKLVSFLAVPAVLAGTVGVASALGPPPPTPVPVPCAEAPHDHKGSDASPGPEAPSGPGVCLSPSPFPSVLHTPPPSGKPPRKAPPISARTAILEDLDSGQVLFARRPDEERPLASTTKIMTALVALQEGDPRKVIRVGPDAAEEGRAGAGFSEFGLELGERITVEQLLYALMLQSANDASVALAEGLAGTPERFVAAMNRRARAMGLHHTKFFSPSGLDDRGHSTARELAVITRQAFQQTLFSRIVETKFHDVPSEAGRARHIQNRNVLLWLYRGAIGGKTGYTSAAGFCLVAAAERGHRRLLAIVLGEPSGDDSFDDAASLLNFGFRGFRRVTLAREGQALAPVPVGTETLPVRAATGLTPLLPVGRAGKVKRVARVRPGLELPLAEGTRVGTVRFLLGGRPLGGVSMVVPTGARTEPPGPSSGAGRPVGSPWYARGAGAVVSFATRALWSLFG